MIFVQLLLHKQLTRQKLVVISGLDSKRVDEHLQFLWRMGILNKIQNDVFEINIYWYPVIVEYLTAKNFI